MKYAETLTQNDLLNNPNRIFNLDETGLTTDPRCGKVFVNPSSKTAYSLSATEGKVSFSVLFCVSASGIYLPPFTIYKGKHLYEKWTLGGPKGASYGSSDSGWMTAENFESWFKGSFVKEVEKYEKPVLLLFDGHASHLTYNTVKSAMDNKIIILCLPPSTSHALQPLDVGVFKPLKNEWKMILREYARDSRLKSVDKTVFPLLLNKLWSKLSPEHAISGFRGTGLYPVNKAAVEKKCIQPELLGGNNSELEEPGTGELPTPRKLLQKSIIKVISPNACETSNRPIDGQKKGKRIERKSGEILTEHSVLQKLKDQQDKKEAGSSGIKKSKRKSVKCKLIEELSDGECSSTSDIEESFSSISLRENKSKRCRMELTENKTFVIVLYEGEKFPGLVTKVTKCKVSVKCMQMSGGYWKWPKDEDIHDYPVDDILQIIEPPTIINDRGSYKIPELIQLWGITPGLSSF